MSLHPLLGPQSRDYLVCKGIHKKCLRARNFTWSFFFQLVLSKDREKQLHLLTGPDSFLNLLDRMSKTPRTAAFCCAGSSDTVRKAGKLLHGKKGRKLSLGPVAEPFTSVHSSVCSFKVLKLMYIQMPYQNEQTTSLQSRARNGQEMPEGNPGNLNFLHLCSL